MDAIQTKYGRAKIDKEGYYRITSTNEGNHGKKLHRLIFEDFYKISLPSHIIIHHNDENKTNNKIWNLIPMTLSEHIRLHSKGRVMSDDARKKISQVHKGKKLSNQQIQQLKEMNSGEDNPMYGQHHSLTTKKKISKQVRQHTFCGRNVYFKKSHSSADVPRKCFEMRYNKWTLPIGWFMEWVSCEIINSLIDEAVSCH